MATTLATGQITIIDMNDAIISGTAPTNPSVGTLWLKEIEDGPDELYSWNGREWILQQISLGGLDPGANQKIETAIDKLTNISKDSIITVSERLEVLNQVMLIVGKTLAETADMPTITDIDVNIRKGELFSVRREAANAGVATSHAAYAAVETTYNNLRTYLNPMSPKPWNVTLDSNITVVPDTWRTKWLDYYNAVATLREIVAAKQKENTDNAHTKIDDMANDNKLTPNEKQDTKKEWDIIQSEKTMIEQQATTFGITTEKESYLLAFNNLSTYITPLLSNLTVTTTIDGPTFRAKFKDYYDKKTAVLKKISDLTFNKFDDLANDNKLTPSEKKTVQREWEIIQTEKPILETQGSALAITTELNTYLTSFNNLKDYLLPLLTVLTVESTINGVEFRTKFTNYFTAKTALLKKINDIAHDQLDDIASDDKVTPNEKYALKKEWDTIKDEKPGLDVQATGLKITTELTAYRNSYAALETYVTPLFNVMTSTSDVDGQLLRTRFTDYYAARNNLMRVINDLKVDIDDFNGNNVVTLLNDPATTFKIRMKQLDFEGGITISELSQEAKNMVASGNQDFINTNPSFFDWTGTYPNGYVAASGAAPTKVTGDNNNGFAARYVSSAANQYMSQTISNKPFYQYVYVEITFKLESGTLDAAGVLFRYLKADGTTTLYDQNVKLKDLVPTVQLNKWYTVSKVLKVTVSSDFSKYQVFVMPNFATFATVTAKTIQFSSVKTRAATEQEIKAYEASATISANSSTWGRASNINSDGTFNTSKLSGQVTDAQVQSSGNWNATRSAVNDMSNDNKVTPIEKTQLKKEWAVISTEKPQYEALAGTYSADTEKTNYVNAYNALNTTVSAILANMTTTSDINGATFRSTFDDYYDKKAQLTRKINELSRTLANNAQSTATNALNGVNDMTSDMKITPLEKSALKTTWEQIKAEYGQVFAQASSLNVSSGDFVNAYNALNGTTPKIEVDILSSMNTTYTFSSTTVRDTFRSQIATYFNEAEKVRKAINDSINNLAGAANTAAGNAQSSADNANTAANNAQTSANTANQAITDMSSDSKITPVEKVQLKKEMAVIIAEKPQFESVATTYAITTEKTNYVNTYNTLNTAVSSILSNMSSTTDVNGATFRNTFDDYYSTKSVLVKKINELARSIGNNAQTSANTANDKITLSLDANNYNPNPSFEGKKNTFYTGATAFAATDAGVPSGAPKNFVGRQTARDNYISDYFSVKAGDKFLVEGWIASTDSTQSFGLGLNTMTNDGTNNWLVSNHKPKGTGAWQYFSNIYTVTAGHTKARFFSQINANSSFGNWFFTDVRITKILNDDIIASAGNWNDTKTMVDDMSKDSKITPLEKVQLKKEWAAISAEKPQYESLATTYEVGTEKTNYINSFNALNTLISSILSNMSVTSDVNGATFRSTFDDYYDKKAQLIKKINELSRDIATGARQMADTVNGIVTSNKAAWDDAKAKIDLWKYSGDQLKINGGTIALRTIFAQQIALADFTNLCQINETSNPLDYTIVTVANDKHFRVGTGAYAMIDLAEAPQVEFKVNDEYYLGFIGYKESGITDLYFKIRYHYTDGTWTNGASTSVPIQTNGGFVETSAKITVAPTSGKTIKRVRFFLEKDGGTSGYFYLRNIELRKKNGAELIVDGAIRGKHILADEVDTQHLKANIIKAKHLDVNSITWNDVARGGQLILGGVNNVNGELVVYGQDEEDIRVQLNTLMEDNTYSSGFQKLTAQDLYVANAITAPNIVTKTTSSFNLNVNPIDGDDENDGLGWGTPLATIQEAVNRLPKFLAHDVEIGIHYDKGTEMYENIVVEGFTGPGSLLINFQNTSNTLYGDITFSYVNCSVKINRGRVISTRDAAPVYVLGCSGFTAQGTIVDSKNLTGYGFYISNARGDLRDCETYNANTAAIIAAYGSQVDVINCKGSAKSGVGIRSYRASIIAVVGTYPAGTRSEYDGGIIRGTFPTDPPPVPPTPTTPTPTTYKTVTVTSTSQKSWRPGFGGQWYRSEVCQGLYSSSYGRYKGFWFFGTQFDQFNGKVITKIRIYTKRYSGGGTAASQKARFILHGHSSQPSSSSSSPAIYGGDGTSVSATSGFEWGEAKWVDVTNAFKSYLNQAGVKGIGLWVNANSPYMLFSGSLKVEVTYKV